MTTRSQRTYDHRLRALVHSTGNPQPAIDRGVPASTARGWVRSPLPNVVTLDELDLSVTQLQAELFVLRAKYSRLQALLRLTVVLIRACGSSLTGTRVPEGSKKRAVLNAIDFARESFPLRNVLRVLGLSAARYSAWSRAGVACGLDDFPSCPRIVPHQLTPDEVRVVKRMVTAPEYRHVPTGALAMLARRMGTVFGSAATWYRLVRAHGWRRPRQRIHPAKPKLGIRASQPNEIWHTDATVIRLLDGSRAYLHAVIDNFSRRILAWELTDRFDITASIRVLLTAARQVAGPSDPPAVLVDGGVENFNPSVDRLIEDGVLRRLLAMTDVAFSNSLIESWWRSLKHQWLFLNRLDTVAHVRKLVAFYVEEHNTRVPHSAFRGQTPDEMYFGTGDTVPDELQ